MYERERAQIAQTPETEQAPPSLLWAQRDYLSELVAARYRNPDVANFDELVHLSALPSDHASKMKKQTEHALGMVNIEAIDQFEQRLHESGAPLGVDPKDVDYDGSWRTCRRLRASLEKRKTEAAAGRDLSQLDGYGYMKHTLGEHDLLGTSDERALSAVIWSARSQLSLARPELGRILRSGNFEQVSVATVTTNLEDEPRLRQLFQHYREALDTLTLYNQRLALGYVKKRSTKGMRSDEVMVGAQMGLRRAAELFDASTGLQFSTFATPWLRQSVDREVARAGLIKLPARVYQQQSILYGVLDELVLGLGRTPSVEEVEDYIGRLKKKIKAADRAPKRYDGLTRQVIIDLMQGPRVTLSLDKPIGDDDSRTYHDTVGAAVTDNTSAFELQLTLRQMADAAHLTEEEGRVFAMMMDHGSSNTPTEIVKLLVADLKLHPNRARRLVSRVREKLASQASQFSDIAFE